MLNENILALYKNEAWAIEAFKNYRLKSGIVCKKCNCTEHYWLNSKAQFQCRACRFRTTLRSGSILEGSKLPYGYFFIALHLLMIRGNTISIDEFQRYTGHKYYDPLYVFIRKIKHYMKNNESNTTYTDFTEIVKKHFMIMER